MANQYSNPYLMSESSLSLFAVYYWTSYGVLERKSNSLLFSLFSVWLYVCLMTAILPHFTFIPSSLLHGSPFVLSKSLVKFLFVLQCDTLFNLDMNECAVLCIHFSREKVLSVYLFNFIRLHWSVYVFSLPGLIEVVDWTKSSDDGSCMDQNWYTMIRHVTFILLVLMSTVIIVSKSELEIKLSLFLLCLGMKREKAPNRKASSNQNLQSQILRFCSLTSVLQSWWSTASQCPGHFLCPFSPLLDFSHLSLLS